MDFLLICQILLRIPSLFYFHGQDSQLPFFASSQSTNPVVSKTTTFFQNAIQKDQKEDASQSKTSRKLYVDKILNITNKNSSVKLSSEELRNIVKIESKNQEVYTQSHIKNVPVTKNQDFSKIILYYMYKFLFFSSNLFRFDNAADINTKTAHINIDQNNISSLYNDILKEFATISNAFISICYNNHDIKEIEKLQLNIFILWCFKIACLLLFIGVALLPIDNVILIYRHVITGILCLVTSLISKYYIMLQNYGVDHSQSGSIWDWFVTDSNKPQRFVLDDPPTLITGGGFLLLHGLIGTIASRLVNFDKPLLARLLFSAFSLPVLAHISHVCPVTELHLVHNFSAFVLVLIFSAYFIENINTVAHAFKVLFAFLCHMGRENGLLAMPFLLWQHYHMSGQLLVFWISLFASRLYIYFSLDGIWSILDMDGGYLIVILRSLSESCGTPLCLLALCVTVSYLSYSILCLTKYILHGRNGVDPHDILHRGWAEAITFLLVALQTDLTTLKSSQRANLMIIVLFILLSSLLESVHDIVGPHLLSLAAAYQSTPISKHIKALILATVLWIAPIYMTVCFCRLFEVDLWLLIIAINSLLTTVQMISTIVIYAIFIIDYYREEPSDNFDNIVFYIKSAVRLIEFVVAVTVVGFGLKECIFGTWSFISFIILLVYFWFNVLQRIQSGWSKFLLRRKAVKRLNALREATKEEISQLNDVCAICFSEMNEARKTACNHFFHSFCLKRWLYIRDTCPLCQKSIDVGDEGRASPDSSEQDDDHLEPIDVSDSTDSELYRRGQEDDGIDLGIYCSDAGSSRRSSASDEIGAILRDSPPLNEHSVHT